MTLEEQMKAELDGWFFALDYERGTTQPTRVSRNYIPNHKPRFSMELDQEKPQFDARKFTPAQDAVMISMRQDGYTWQEIGRAVKHDPGITRARYVIVCRERGIAPEMDIRKRRQDAKAAFAMDL